MRGVSTGVHKQLYRGTVPSSSLSVTSLVLQFFGVPFFQLSRKKGWCFSYSAMSGTSVTMLTSGPSGMRAEEIKQRGFVHPLGP